MNYIYKHTVNLHSFNDKVVPSTIGLCTGYRVQEAVHGFVNNQTLVIRNDVENFYPLIFNYACDILGQIPRLSSYHCDSGPIRDVVGALFWSDDSFREGGMQRFLLHDGYDVDTMANCMCSHDTVDCSEIHLWEDVRQKIAVEVQVYKRNRRNSRSRSSHSNSSESLVSCEIEGIQCTTDSSLEDPRQAIYYNHSNAYERNSPEVAISLGYNCQPAMRSKDYKFRQSKKEGYKTCPFDVMLSNYEGLVRCLQEDFRYLTDSQYLRVIDVPVNDTLHVPHDKVIINTRYNFLFYHDSPVQYIFDDYQWENGLEHFVVNDFAALKERYKKRVSNFVDYMGGGYEVLLVMLAPTLGYKTGFPRLNKVLHEKYPNSRYRFAKFNHLDDNEQFQVHHVQWMGVNTSSMIY